MATRTFHRSVVAVVGTVLVTSLWSTVGAASVAPIFYEGATNRTCASFNSTWIETKLDVWGDGSVSSGNLTVTLFNTTSDAISWSSNVGVDAVYLKGGSRGSNLYVYDPESTGDTDLVIPNAAQNGISHVSFCWDDDGGGEQQAEPDVTVTKTAFAADVNAGDGVGFTIAVFNQGLDPATDVSLTDSLPALAGGWTLGGADAGSCGISGLSLTCLFPTIGSQEERSFTVTGTSSGADCGPLDNVVTVSAEGDIDPTNNEASASIFVHCADVGVEKTADAPAVDLGGALGFALVVTSHGPENATGVTLTDALPGVGDGWTLGGPDASSCGIDNGTLSCSFGQLAPGETRAITLSAGTSAIDDCGDWTNAANVAADLDIDATNDASSASVHVTCADVSVVKTSSDPAVDYGGSLGFTITVTSEGPDDATSVTLTDALPEVGDGWALGGPDAASCSIDNGTLSCDFGDIPASESRTVTLTTTAGALDDCGDWSNTASIGASLDIGASNDQSSASVHVTCADVGVEKIADANAVDLGGALGFTLVVTSYGPDNATGVTLSDPLPSVGDGWTLGGADAGDCGIDLGTLACAFGEIPAGETRTVTIHANTSAIDDCGDWTNAASVAADVDTDGTNDAANATIHVTCADVSAQKSADAATIDFGAALGFTIVVTSHGPDEATGVTLVDALPGVGGAWSLGGSDAGACSIDNGTLSCDFGDVPAGQTRTITLSTPTAAISDCGDWTNTATASAGLDTNASNDASSAGVHVTCADVSLVKTGSATSVAYNSSVAFNLSVSSHGPDAAENVSLADMLPWTAAGWTLGGPDAGACALSDRNLTCDFGTVPAGETRLVTVSTIVGGANCGPFANGASVDARLDTNASNDASTATIGVTCVDPHTQGYWKNHASAWPVSSLVLGDETYTKLQLLVLLKLSPGNDKKADASLILAHQLISAKLNVAAGAPADVIAPTIAGADAILAPFTGKLPYKVHPSTAIGAQMVALAATLDAYNNGLLTGGP